MLTIRFSKILFLKNYFTKMCIKLNAILKLHCYLFSSKSKCSEAKELIELYLGHFVHTESSLKLFQEIVKINEKITNKIYNLHAMIKK